MPTMVGMHVVERRPNRRIVVDVRAAVERYLKWRTFDWPSNTLRDPEALTKTAERHELFGECRNGRALAFAETL